MFRPVQDEIPAGSPVEKQERPVAGPLDSLQELLRDDLVRIDVRTIQRRHSPGDAGNRFHYLSDTRIRIANAGLNVE